MVLVDTSPAGEGLIEQNQPGFDAVYGGVESNTTPLLNCAFLAVKGPLDPSEPEHEDCIPTLPSDAPPRSGGYFLSSTPPTILLIGSRSCRR